jgi:hypothetical protein
LRLGDGEREARTGDRDAERGVAERRGDLECAERGRLGDRVRERSREMLHERDRDGDRAGDGLREGMFVWQRDGSLLLACLVESLRSLRKAMSISALVAVATKLKLEARQELPGALARDPARPIRVKGCDLRKHHFPSLSVHAWLPSITGSTARSSLLHKELRPWYCRRYYQVLRPWTLGI